MAESYLSVVCYLDIRKPIFHANIRPDHKHLFIRPIMAVLFGCLLLLSSAFASVERRNTVCYSPFGCFSSDGLLKAPQSPDVVDTYFRLYVRGHSSHINEIGGKAGRVTSDFNKYRLSVYSIYNIIVRFIFRLATKHFASKCTTSKEKHSCCILQLIR